VIRELLSLDCKDKPLIEIWNKIDLMANYTEITEDPSRALQSIDLIAALNTELSSISGAARLTESKISLIAETLNKEVEGHQLHQSKNEKRKSKKRGNLEEDDESWLLHPPQTDIDYDADKDSDSLPFKARQRQNNQKHNKTAAPEAVVAPIITATRITERFVPVQIQSHQTNATGLSNVFRALNSEISKDHFIVVASAKTGFGLEGLLEKLESLLELFHRPLSLFIPYEADQSLISLIHAQGKIWKLEYQEKGVYIECSLPDALAERLKPFS
jgi:50S ribosomal subunit-associated GTPase HflX